VYVVFQHCGVHVQSAQQQQQQQQQQQAFGTKKEREGFEEERVVWCFRSVVKYKSNEYIFSSFYLLFVCLFVGLGGCVLLF